jgi:hypothetical protein
MTPNLFVIDSERLFGALLSIIALSFLVERALAVLFENRWFVERYTCKGLKEPITVLVAFGVCRFWDFDAFASRRSAVQGLERRARRAPRGAGTSGPPSAVGTGNPSRELPLLRARPLFWPQPRLGEEAAPRAREPAVQTGHVRTKP